MIKDRVLLGILAGTLGNMAKMAIDEVSLRQKISQRSFRSTAAGVWLNKRQTETTQGQILGGLFDFGMSALGGIGAVQLLTTTGRDQIIAKGLLTGITMGSLVTAALSFSPTNKVRPKDAASNLSYMVSHAVYGLVATTAAAKLGDASIYTEKSPAASFIRAMSSNVK